MVTRQLLLVLILLGATWWTVSHISDGSGLRGIKSTISARRISEVDINLANLLPPLDFKPGQSQLDYYASDAAREFCAAHGFPVFSPLGSSPPAPGMEASSDSSTRVTERKIYDLIMVNSELDFLEIRLRTMYHYVDYFVIVESPLTFQGGPKPLTIRDSWDAFAAYHDKMIYHELIYPEGFVAQLTWDYEDLQRNAALTQVFPTLEGRQAPVMGDVLFVADVDEIPRPATLLVLRTCDFPRRLTLTSRFFYYSFQFLHTGSEWPHPEATFYQGPPSSIFPSSSAPDKGTLLPSTLRAHDGGSRISRARESATLSNAGWHCSSCFSTVAEFLNKMASFSHLWMNDGAYRDRDLIAAAVRDGRDLWGRRSETFVRVDGNLDVPGALLEEPERFRYMLNRDGESAGFTDYP